jgi:hypothetical protein
MLELALFRVLIGAHILCGATGAIAFWLPVVGRKGSQNHKRAGRVFTKAVLITGGLAIAMSLMTLYDPIGVHPHLRGQFDAVFIRALFGWMMLHNGILTINLAHYGWLCAKNRHNVAANRTPFNIALQYGLLVAALVCAFQGLAASQPLLPAIALVGLATAATNLAFLYRRAPRPVDWLKEHIKALVGAGISVYTAFMAFGSVRLMPSLALNPMMWAIPLSVGLTIIIVQRSKVERQAGRRLAPSQRNPAAALPD